MIKIILPLAISLFSVSSIDAKMFKDYTAYISKHDLVNSSGKKITSAAGILQQDRVNYHKFKKRDPGDTSDGGFFAKKENRTLFGDLLNNTDKSVLNTIRKGNVKVRVWTKSHPQIGEYVVVSLVSIAAELPHAIDTAKDVAIRVAQMSEDATSTSYFFSYQIKGNQSVDKIRILWNGGAQNPPTTKDYYLNKENKVSVVHRSYERKHLPLLLNGGNPPSKIVEASAFKLSPYEVEASHGPKGDRQKNDLRSLIHAMRMTKYPLNSKK